MLEKLNIPAGTLLPSSFRPGGATYLFQLWNEDVRRLQWRGRWQSLTMLERYVQESQAIHVWHGLSLAAREAIMSTSSLAESLLGTFRPEAVQKPA